ncbi:hypothetical protein A1O7_03045 [Cladophialophora yegresii CBS 114405]|uniref:Protein SMG7 n=1 Tax=Cladophialophora yegresii CBS 114405 TaxID=1182544 RepID=W9W3H0_9EURO|nr:uncharacterized protein A1O7_03045 [Cladophialophora yegresii CBS 114405]EXJ62607.1 hypothetical protein A1O7_03045 [Cladophialophora yegresii CBS 114405]
MEDIALRASKNVDRSENDITLALSRSETKHENLEPLLAKFRAACQDYIFIDFAAAAEKRVEARLWTAHSKVNSRFRPLMARFREGDGQKLKVERRKAEKVYLVFIKSSQAFYRGYIQRLASNFKGIPEILTLARGMELDTLSADTPQPADAVLKGKLIDSCYSALVQCGDLSRYRETELKTHLRNWGPAVGYYNKAAVLKPADGRAYNQLAVIALSDQDHLRAVYHLYQAICVEIPFPQARDNLELEFKKLRVKSNQGKPIAGNSAVFKGDPYLYEQFLLFHARCWEEKPRAQEEQQIEIFRLINDQIRQQPEATILRKFSLVNIAAEKSAAEKAGGEASALRSFKIFQSFNIKTFSLLLKLVLEELQLDAEHIGLPATNPPAEVPPITRRTLPHLRLYTGWLLTSIQYLLANAELASQMQQLWRLYARALNLLLQLFPPSDAEIEYLLKEDAETLGFSAFSQFVRDKRFRRSSQFKPIYNEASFGPPIPNNEMLFRIKEFIREAMFLFKSVEFNSVPVPLTFAGKRFVYLGDEDRSAQAEKAADAFTGRHESVQSANAEYVIMNGGIVRQLPSQQEIVPDAEGSMASRMENMVDDLTRPGIPREEINRSSIVHDSSTAPMKTPLAQTFADRGNPPSQTTFTARDLVQRMQHSSGGSQPSPRAQAINIAPLPSIWNTPFAPRPGETPESSPRPSSAHHFALQASVSPNLSSSAEFHTNLVNLQEEIQTRTSPQSSLQPTISSHYETPTNLTSWIRAHDPMQPASSPWQSPFTSAVPVHQTPIPTKHTNASPFGAIGESRPRSSRTPNGGQPG